MVPNKCPGGNYKCDYDDTDDEDNPQFYNPHVDDFDETPEHTNSENHSSNKFYIMTLVPMMCIIILCIILVTFLLIKKGKKKYPYASSRSFSNPNYYSSSNNDANHAPPNNAENRKQFIWKRLKYDKSQVSIREGTRYG